MFWQHTLREASLLPVMYVWIAGGFQVFFNSLTWRSPPPEGGGVRNSVFTQIMTFYRLHTHYENLSFRRWYIYCHWKNTGNSFNSLSVYYLADEKKRFYLMDFHGYTVSNLRHKTTLIRAQSVNRVQIMLNYCSIFYKKLLFLADESDNVASIHTKS